MKVKLVEIIAGFLFFSSLIMINAIVTKKLILKNLRKSNLILLLSYPFKFIIYLVVLIAVEKWIGLTFSFIIGIMLSLILFSLISLVVQTNILVNKK
ncbi:hypothetical protein HRbin19_00493 [bacterium HR19]|nr:hypothetical protein HRbin19_00493 [bacterium HR19]